MSRWSKEECERRYVEGADVTLKALSEISGVSFNTLRKWSSLDNWKQKRLDFQSQLKAQTREKTIQKTSDILSDELSQITMEHLEVYRIYREIAAIRGRFVLDTLKKAFPTDAEESDDPVIQELRKELQSRELTKLDVMALSLLSQMADRCIRGERMAAGLEYEDINKAIAAVERAGFKVAADGATLAQFVTAEVREERSTDSTSVLSTSDRS